MILSRRTLLVGFTALAAARGLPALPADLSPAIDVPLEFSGYQDILAELLRMFAASFGHTPAPDTPDYVFCEISARSIWDIQQITQEMIKQLNPQVATGEALDKLGINYGIQRQSTEADASYRARIRSRIVGN